MTENQDQEIEERAKLMGWKPESEFRGDKSKWKPAEEWVEYADNVLPIMKAQNRKYEEELTAAKQELTSAKSEVTATKAEVSALRKTMEKMVSVSSKISEQEYKRALATIRKEQAAAISDGNADRWQELETQKDELAANRPEKIEFEQPATQPDMNAGGDVLSAWKADNDWYEKNAVMAAFASAVEGPVAAANIGKSPREILDKVTEEVKKRFPENFANPNQNRPADVDTGGQPEQSKKSGKVTYRDLDADARAMCDNLVETIPGYTREKFLEGWNSEE